MALAEKVCQSTIQGGQELPARFVLIRTECSLLLHILCSLSSLSFSILQDFSVAMFYLFLSL